MKRGAVAFVEKPYQNDDLVHAIRMAMESQRRRGSPRRMSTLPVPPAVPLREIEGLLS